MTAAWFAFRMATLSAPSSSAPPCPAREMGRRRARPDRRIQPDHHRMTGMARPIARWAAASRRRDRYSMLGGSTRGIAVSVALILGCSCLAIATAGCSDAFNAGPLQYVEAEALTKDLGNKANLHGKPKLQAKVRKALAQLYGPIPSTSASRRARRCSSAGVYLANYVQGGRGRRTPTRSSGSTRARTSIDPEPQAAGRRLRDLPPQLPALPRRLRGRRRPDRAVPLSPPARLPQGDLQVHLDAQRRQARTATTCAGRSPTACTGPRCRPSSRSRPSPRSSRSSTT